MKYSKQYIASLSEQNHFLGANLEKVLRLLDVLDLIFSNPDAASKLVLKGGTAINLCYSGLKRLSVDIDLDYVGSQDVSIVKKDRSEILSFIENSLSNEGYSVSHNSRAHYALSSQTFVYENASGNKDTIKVEINFMDRVHLFEPKASILSFFGKKHSFIALQKEELFGSKIAALLDRTKPRDLYDVYWLANDLANIDLERLRLSLLFYLAMDDIFEYSNQLFSRVDSLTYKDIRAELKPVLSKDDPFDLPSSKKSVKSFLASIVLEANELNFLSMAKQGKYDFSLLSTDQSFIDKMSNHPMVLWKKKRKVD
jgi:predicted nucleotidyltransferase component of viral defense system